MTDRKPEEPAFCHEAASQGDNPRGRLTTILLIEDIVDQLDMYELVLLDAGYRVVRATHGRMGYQSAIAERPDVAIIDLSLPDIDGWSVCTLLRDNPRTATIPIIILTAGDDYDIPLRAERFKVDVLQKPCPADRLIAAIRGAVDGD